VTKSLLSYGGERHYIKFGNHWCKTIYIKDWEIIKDSNFKRSEAKVNLRVVYYFVW
jgi:hypothetical protein